MLDRVKVHLFSKIDGKVRKIFLILVRKDDILDVVSEGSKGFLLQTSDGQDPSS